MRECPLTAADPQRKERGSVHLQQVTPQGRNVGVFTYSECSLTAGDP